MSLFCRRTCPYGKDPERHPGLIFHNCKPCNAELPAELMMDSWLTPNPVWLLGSLKLQQDMLYYTILKKTLYCII